MIVADKESERLRACMLKLGLTEIEAMNMLQDRGIISDLCVWIEDVANEDVDRAISFLTNETTK